MNTPRAERVVLRIVNSVLIGFTVVVAMSACNSGSRGPSKSSATKPGTAMTSPSGSAPSANISGSGGAGGMIGIQSRTITVSGQAMDYLVYAPAQYDAAQSWPVLFVFHGQGGTNMNTLNSWLSLADMNGIIVVATQGSAASGGWVPSADSLIFQEALNDTESTFNIDTKRRYMWGFSAGGHFVHIVGLGNSQFFAAYAVSAGVVQQGYSASRQIPVSIHIGNSDPLLANAQMDLSELTSRGHPVDFHEFQGGHTVLPGHLQQAWDDMKVHSRP